MAGPVTRDEFTELGKRMTAAELMHEDLATRVDRGFAEMRDGFNTVHKDVGKVREHILGLNLDMADVKRRLDGNDKLLRAQTELLRAHGALLQAQSEMHISHAETLQSHTETLQSHTQTLQSHSEMHASHAKKLESHTEMLEKILSWTDKIEKIDKIDKIASQVDKIVPP